MSAHRTLRAAVLALAAAAAGAGVARAGEEAEGPKGGPKELASLKYRLVGPAAGGRVDRVAGVPGDPLTYYAATASGGVWKSADGGIRWKPIFDDQPACSIGSIAVAPSDPNVVYVGHGRGQHPRQRRSRATASTSPPTPARPGSTSGSRTARSARWSSIPTNPDIAFAAVLGKAFGPNPERGVYRTRDGGKTWQKVLYKDAGHRRLRRRARPKESARSCSPGSGRRGAGPGS